MAFALRCPECRDKFPWDPKAKFPRFCPLCSADINNDRPDNEIVMPSIRKARTAVADKLYRDMEKGSEIRAQAAAAMTGSTVEDMSGLKITDLNDRKDSEVAAVMVDNDVTKHMAAVNARGGSFGWQDNSAAREFAAGTATGAITVNGRTINGIEPRAGANAMSKLQRIMGK